MRCDTSRDFLIDNNRQSCLSQISNSFPRRFVPPQFALEYTMAKDLSGNNNGVSLYYNVRLYILFVCVFYKRKTNIRIQNNWTYRSQIKINCQVNVLVVGLISLYIFLFFCFMYFVRTLTLFCFLLSTFCVCFVHCVLCVCFYIVCFYCCRHWKINVSTYRSRTFTQKLSVKLDILSFIC